MRSEQLAYFTIEPAAWKSLPRRGDWAGFSHEESGSEVWARHAAARRTVTLKECEDGSRQSFSLLRAPGSDASSSELSLRDELQGRVQTVLLPAGGGRVEGFFVGVGTCLSFLFVTSATPGFPERLQYAETRILPSLRLLSLDERNLGLRL